MYENLLNENVQKLHIISGFEIKQKAKILEDRGINIIHLEIGEPDFTTPSNIIDEGIEALSCGDTHYTPASGIMDLRKEISKYISTEKNISVDHRNIVVTSGAKPILFYTISAFVKSWDEVIIPNPGFPVYSALVKYAGGTVVPAITTDTNTFTPSAEDIISKVTSKTKLIILNSPNNPSGAIMKNLEVEKLAAFLKNRDIIVLSDEIYDRLIYTGEKARSIASYPGMIDKTIILDGFSKTYAMTGWRLGFGVMNEDLAKIFNKLIVTTTSCVPKFVQRAGIEALKGPRDKLLLMKKSFEERRDLLVNGLNRIEGINCSMPSGAFYVFPKFTNIKIANTNLADYVLEEGNIASLPGSTFGINLEDHLRFSFAASKDDLIKAVSRLEKMMRVIRK